jgi:hypothetical protein
MTTFRMGVAALTLQLLASMIGDANLSTQKQVGSVAATGNMTVVRFDHAAALLPNGEVLIVGGISRNGVMQPTAELFDPTKGRFTPTGKPLSPHGWGVTATALRDGKVLVAGGSTSCEAACYTASAELYDPAKGTFVATGSMTVPRAGARALPLPSGDVLFVGGDGKSAAATAELYSASTGSFSALGETHHSDPTQLLQLKNGLALAIGSSATDIYDPTTHRFTASGNMIVPRDKFGAAVLSDGRVLIVGGQSGGAWGGQLTSTEIYDPGTGRFAPGPDLNMKRFKLSKAVVALKNGRILVAGGAEHPEVYDPVSRVFFPVAGTTMDGFLFSTATILSDGKVLLAGGYEKPGSSGVNHAWIYEP